MSLLGKWFKPGTAAVPEVKEKSSEKLEAAKRYANAVQERMLKQGIISPIRNKGKENGNATA